MTPQLAQWFRETHAQRTAAGEAGSTNIDWALPEYRVRFTELCAKADEMGIKYNPVDLRLWAEDELTKETSARTSASEPDLHDMDRTHNRVKSGLVLAELLRLAEIGKKLK